MRPAQMLNRHAVIGEKSGREKKLRKVKLARTGQSEWWDRQRQHAMIARNGTVPMPNSKRSWSASLCAESSWRMESPVRRRRLEKLPAPLPKGVRWAKAETQIATRSISLSPGAIVMAKRVKSMARTGSQRLGITQAIAPSPSDSHAPRDCER